jgi:4-amino-4-deoxy-L-arabinose transferase-like glycosyltransferase
MTAGLGSLIAVYRILALVAARWTALAGSAILGTWLLFVREHHHGLYDAPAAGCGLLALWMATAHVRAPSLRRIVAAGALAGLATSFKYNLAPSVVAVLATAVVVEPGWRLRTVVAVVVAAAVAFVLTTPEIVIDHARWRDYLAGYIPLQKQILTVAGGPEGNHLLENLSRGIGWIGIALASVGFAVAATARERALVPVLTFVVLYGLVLVTTPLALTRYILPIAGSLAVLVAFGLSRLPAPLGVTVAAFVVGVGLPSCVQYVRLLAVEDTRVEAARLVEAEWARGGHVLIAANPVLASYVGPDLPQLPRYDPGLPPSVQHEIDARAPQCTRSLDLLVVQSGMDPSDALRVYAGALVVTSDSPAPAFARASTPPDLAAALEGEAALVADLRVERTPAQRAYEVLDLNYVPFTGLASLIRPGPRLRIWRIPGR